MSRDTDAVIFDMDGVITDTEKIYYRAWPEALRSFGYDAPDDIALELRSLGRPFAPEFLKEKFGADFDYDAVRNLRRKLVRDYLEDGIPLKDGVTETLQRLREEGFTVAIATSNSRSRMDRYLDRLGLAHLFDSVICADMVERGKPAPDIYLHAVRTLGVEPSRAVAVEDSPNGIRSAYKAGLKVIMIPDLTGPDEELKGMLTACLASLRDIPGFLMS